MIRATTGGVMRTYRSNLMNSFINMNSNRNTVLSQRTFNSYAEDPASAAKAFRLRKSRMMVESQYNICTDTMKKYEGAVACLQSIDDILCTKDGVYGQYMTTLTGTTLSMLNDPSGDARTQLAKALDQMSQSIIQTMNQKYGDNFIFAGADGHNVPFEIRDDGKLYYRGVPVDAAIPDVLKDGDGFIAVTKDGKYPVADGDDVYYLKSDQVSVISKEEYEKLYNLPDVKTYIEKFWSDNFDENMPLEYDANGNPSILLDTDGETPLYDEYGNTQPNPDYDGVGGWYALDDGEFDDDGNPVNFISKEEYAAIQSRRENMPQFLENSDDSGELVEVDENGIPTPGGGYYMMFNGDAEDAVISEDEYNTAVLDYEKLEYLANEKYYVDIGLGFQENDRGELIKSSAFNAALSGLNFLGYGLDEDGDPKNLYSLVQKMKDIALSVDDGTDWSNETYDEFYRLVQKFEDGVSNYQTEFVNLDAGTAKLKNQQGLLEENFYNLQEQYSDLEDVDMVDAITSFIWAEYCYNAALKVGNSILGQSLMDYLS